VRDIIVVMGSEAAYCSRRFEYLKLKRFEFIAFSVTVKIDFWRSHDAENKKTKIIREFSNNFRRNLLVLRDVL